MGREILSALLLVTALPAMADERPVTLASTPAPLHGTLLSAGSGPAILMIPGSGPTDRNGNSPLGIRAATYRLLAEGLAARGISTLRVDKRGIGESGPAATAESALRFQTYVDDTRAWAAELRKWTGASCVWLLGHSEGALVAEAAAQKADGICGLVLISGAGRKAAEVIADQLGALPSDQKQKALAVLSELEAGRAVADPPAQLAALFRPSVQPYLMSWLPMDPAALLAAGKLPVIIIHGDTDIQVPVEDARRLAGARPDARLAILPGVNHILKLAPPDRAANIATYSNPDLPLAPGVVDMVATFVDAQRK